MQGLQLKNKRHVHHNIQLHPSLQNPQRKVGTVTSRVCIYIYIYMQIRPTSHFRWEQSVLLFKSINHIANFFFYLSSVYSIDMKSTSIPKGLLMIPSLKSHNSSHRGLCSYTTATTSSKRQLQTQSCQTSL